MTDLAIIGGGPAALMLAAELDGTKYRVTLYEQKKTVGRKFLVAGEGGLNLTYDESTASLIEHYVPAEFMADCLRAFDGQDLRRWLQQRGVATFVGSSNRVFPLRGLKPVEVLNRIVNHLQARGVTLQLGTKWLGWDDAGRLRFDGLPPIASDVTVFSLGGASWKVTGSDGTWREVFRGRGIQVNNFRAANCAFAVEWDKTFIAAHAGKPLKNIALSFGNKSVTGELVITEFGLEGNALYALSNLLQGTLRSASQATVYVDLKPTLTLARVRQKLRPVGGVGRGYTPARRLKLGRTATALLKQFTSKATYLDPDRLAEAVKALPVPLHAAGLLDEAISSLGGLALDEVNEYFALHKLSGTYAIGEMLDWYAPTGGYLLQGCFSMGVGLARHLNGR